MDRRRMIAGGAAGAAAGLAAPARAQERFRWTMVMPWPRNTPGVGVAADRFAKRVATMSGGRLEIRLYAAGELVPPFEGLDAVQRGTADIAHGTPYYWVGKAPALHFFTGVPFGLTAPELAAWIAYGDGGTLWREIYEPFGVIPFYAGSSGVQAGGWLKREITTVDDLKGLKFRIAGLGGEVMRRLGAVPELTPPGEIAAALLSGRLDAAEWIGPWNDLAFGLYKVAKFYYLPAFHEPGPGPRDHRQPGAVRGAAPRSSGDHRGRRVGRGARDLCRLRLPQRRLASATGRPPRRAAPHLARRRCRRHGQGDVRRPRGARGPRRPCTPHPPVVHELPAPSRQLRRLLRRAHAGDAQARSAWRLSEAPPGSSPPKRMRLSAATNGSRAATSSIGKTR